MLAGDGPEAFRREVVEEIHLRDDWHRYLVVLAHDRGFRIGEIDIDLRPVVMAW